MGRGRLLPTNPRSKKKVKKKNQTQINEEQKSATVINFCLILNVTIMIKKKTDIKHFLHTLNSRKSYK